MCRLRTAAALAALAIGMGAASAHAAFPGTNGLIAYSDADGPQRSIFTIQPDGSGRTRIIQDAVSPSWTADGTRLLFQRGDTGATWVANADGSNQHVAIGASSNPSWSPDGTQIAYALDGAIRIADATTGASRVVLQVPSSRAIRDVEWGPTNQLAYTLYWHKHGKVFGTNIGVVAPSGGTPIVLVQSTTTGRLDGRPGPFVKGRWLSWSPDGSVIATQGGIRQRNGRTPGRATAFVSVPSGATRFGRGAAPFGAGFSPDGRQLCAEGAAAPGATVDTGLALSVIQIVPFTSTNIAPMGDFGFGHSCDWQPIVGG